VGIPVSLRFNIGSVYAIVVGANTGVRWTKYGSCLDASGAKYSCEGPSEVGMFLGPEVSLLNFRFGQKRHLEMAAIQGCAVPLHGTSIFYNTFVFSMLW